MKRAVRFSLTMFCLTLLVGCAGQQVTPQRIYAETQTTYLNAWDSYHKVWSALPDTDPRKGQWVRDYHPKFYRAAELLQAFRLSPGATTQERVNIALNECENILIELAISKGGQ